jgi:fibronectin type 3 domain-containing protein
VIVPALVALTTLRSLAEGRGATRVAVIAPAPRRRSSCNGRRSADNEASFKSAKPVASSRKSGGRKVSSVGNALRRTLLIAIVAAGLAVPTVSSAAIAYIQGTYETGAATAVVNVTYSAAQNAGDLNVVVLAWVDSTPTVQSVTDSVGNTYVAAGSETMDSGVGAQQIYYAKNIKGSAANSNTVTVTFSTAISDSDIRIVEYSGIDPVNAYDGGVGASGTGTTQSSGLLTTTNANDLLVAGNFIAGNTTAVGTGFALHLTTNYAEIVEDKVVTAIGSYSATATQDTSGYWLMQMAAFRLASGGGTPPTVPGAPSLTVVSSSQINLSWAASIDNVGVTAYLIERCASTSCTSYAQVATSTTTSYSDTGLSGSTSYSYQIQAIDAAGNLSPVSSAASATTQAAGAPYVQGAYETGAATAVVNVTYGSAQNAGDLNVVVLAWADSTPTVQSVTDSMGNTYVAAGSATTDSGVGAQQIYYAKNIKSAAANSNTVTITFSTAISDSDIRIVEYSGIDPVNAYDGGVGASGTGTAQSSGSLTTTNANDLLVAGNFIAGETTAVGTGFALRLTTNYAEIVEDEAVTAIGSYSATATQDTSGYWLMQMAAFRLTSGGSGGGTPPTVPGTPSLTVVSSSQINLSWTASTGATGYVIQRCAGASCTSFAQVGTSTTSGYSDTGLTASTSYTYRVDATNAAGSSSFSNTTTGTTTAAGTPPSAPTNLANSVISSSQINLTWTASTGATGYMIQRCAGASCTSFAQVGTSTTASYSNTGLTASTSYSYRVDATNAVGSSGFSNTTTGTTTAALPTAPSNLANSVISSSQINLTWTASTGATGYVIQRCAGASCTSFAQVGTSTTASYSNTGLTASTSYSYRVDATNAVGSSGFSNTTTGTTTAALPTAPSNLANSVISSSQINLTWNASTGATGYVVQRCTGASCTSFAQIGTSTTTSYSDTGLTSSTSYTYRVDATNTAGSSGFSNTTVGTTSASAPTSPPIITSPATGTTVLAGQSLTISATILAGEFPSGVALLAQDPLGSAPIQTVSGTSVSFTLPIPANTPPGPYLITVLGVNSAGAVIPSAQLSVDVEQAAQPSAITAYPTAIFMGSIGDTRTLTVIGSFSGNLQIDISKSSQLTTVSENSAIATAQNGTITGVAIGQTNIDISYGQITLTVPVAVQ